MNSEKLLFNWSDAWLMLAISLASQRGPATLEEIIAAGDEINFSIFSLEELESGLVRLTEARFVAEKSGAFAPTENVRRYAQKFLSDGRQTGERLADVQEMLGAAAAPDDQPCKNNLRYHGLTKEKYEEAVRRYRG
ncbi:MAG TPA: hypothetical protein VLB68_18530 [Pyrinomonadaceae bacterium]|nr:hypothetical protein [Pyrinomonadaceae bacterium]